MDSSDKLIKDILAPDVVSITPVVDRGDVNQVFKVEQKSQTVIVRLNSADNLAKFEKEVWCLEMADKMGIPSPKVLDFGVKNDHSFLVQTFISGLNGPEIIDRKSDIWHKLGGYAQLIQSVQTTGFGDKMTSAGLFSDSWPRYLNYNIDSLNAEDKLVKLGVITLEQSEKLKKLFQGLSRKPFKFGLNHGDLSLANVIVGKSGEVTLIDWGEAESSVVPHLDFIGILQNNLKQDDPLFASFLEGYGMTKAEHLSLKSDLETLTILQAVDKLRWAIDKKPDKIEEFSVRVKRLIDNL